MNFIQLQDNDNSRVDLTNILEYYSQKNERQNRILYVLKSTSHGSREAIYSQNVNKLEEDMERLDKFFVPSTPISEKNRDILP